MKAIEHYFHVVLCIMLYKMVLTLTFMHETLDSEGIAIQMKAIEQ